MSPAAAEMVVKGLDNLFAAGFGCLLEQSIGLKNHAARTETALESLLREKRFLKRMELAVWRQAFQGQELTPVYPAHLCLTRADWFAIDQNRTRAAVTLPAAKLGAGQF